jgi:NAD(P)-dependent dehydrogenase (short-subunit alcohol dehydrogenase family)
MLKAGRRLAESCFYVDLTPRPCFSPGRVALVTGGNRGLGLEACRQLGRLGYRILLTCRNAEQGRTSADLLAREGIDCRFHRLDVTSPADLASLVEFIEAETGRVDVLINNAGIYLDKGKTILEVGLDAFRKTLETNTFGPLALGQALIPIMVRNGYGRIVNVSSAAGLKRNLYNDGPAYRISKAALNALTLLLCQAVRDQNILVNAVCPGWIRSAMGGPNAPLRVEEGVHTLLGLATLKDGGPSGGFYREGRRMFW